MRALGIDYGDTRVGVAVSDALGLMAHGIEVIPNRVYKKMLDRLVQLVVAYQAQCIVIGLPRNMDGSEGFRADATKAFAADLQSLLPDVELALWDERLSTVEAAGILNQTNTRGKSRKAVIDAVAAEIILQSYLDAHRTDI